MGTITLTFYPQLGLAHLQGHGDISESMVIKEVQELTRHPEWRPSYNTLVDLNSAVLRPSATPGRDERQPAWLWSGHRQQPKSPVSKWAIWAADHQNGHWLAERLRTHGGVIVDIFHQHREALHFLDLSPQQWLAAQASDDSQPR